MNSPRKDDLEWTTCITQEEWRQFTDQRLIELLAGKNNLEIPSLQVLGEYCCNSLLQIPKITPLAALRIKAAFELTRRLSCVKLDSPPAITKSHDAFELLLPKLYGLRHEEFWVICLNQRHRVIHHACVSLGGMAYTLVDPKRVFRLALEMSAVKIIVAHNHPSGNLQPSEEDIRMTRKLRDAGLSIECHVLDHLIITDRGYYSFADEGKMNS